MMHPGQAHEAHGQKREYWIWIAKKSIEGNTRLSIELNYTLKPESMHNSIM